jgi:hypothetical protein
MSSSKLSTPSRPSTKRSAADSTQSSPAPAPTPPRKVLKRGHAGAASLTTPIRKTDPAPTSTEFVDQPGAYVQSALHASVQYESESPEPATDSEKAALAAIAAHYIIPQDFDTDKIRYGALSGLTRRSRLLNAYDSKLLQRRGESGSTSSDMPPHVCRVCAGNHYPRECRAVFLSTK